MVASATREDQAEPNLYKPMVAIGHTKDLTEPQTVDAFLALLRDYGIPVATFESIYPKLRSVLPQSEYAELCEVEPAAAATLS